MRWSSCAIPSRRCRATSQTTSSWWATSAALGKVSPVRGAGAAGGGVVEDDDLVAGDDSSIAGIDGDCGDAPFRPRCFFFPMVWTKTLRVL